VVLHGQHGAGLAGGGDHRRGVDGLDGVDVDDLGVDALRGELLRGLQRVGDHDAGGENGHIPALTQRARLEEVELIAVVIDLGQLLAEQTQIDAALVVVDDRQRLGELHLVRRLKEHDVGHGAQDAEVLEAHVRAAVELRRDAGVGADDLDVALGVGDGDRDLIADAARGERRERLDPRLEAVARHTGGDGRHVLLRDARLEALLGILGIERTGADGTAEIGVKHDNVMILRHHLVQSVDVDGLHIH